jgi:hypothetical protein
MHPLENLSVRGTTDSHLFFLQAVPVHVLLGLLSQGPRDCAALLGGNATLDRARKAVQTQTGSHRRDILGSTEVVFSTEAKRVFEAYAPPKDASSLGKGVLTAQCIDDGTIILAGSILNFEVSITLILHALRCQNPPWSVHLDTGENPRQRKDPPTLVRKY